MANIYRASPRFIKAGEGNRVIISSAAMLMGGILSANTGDASLSIYHSGSTVSNVTSAVNKLDVFAKSGYSQKLPDFPCMFPSGMSVSCNGGNARAVLWVSEMK